MRLLFVLLAAGLQAAIPELAFDSTPNPLALPDDIYLGEVGGVAANSRGEIFVYTRTGHPTVSIGTSRPFMHGGSRLFVFDRTGKYLREIGKDSYGMNFAQQVRVDPQDNVWIVDQMSGYVMKLGADGRPTLLLGRKPESVTIGGGAGRAGGGGGEGGGAARGVGPGAGAGAGGRAAGDANAGRAAGGPGAGAPAGGRGRGGLPGAGTQADVFNRPMDVAWDRAGNIFVADGMGNARVAKFDSKGVFIKSWGSRGAEPGLFANVTAIAVDDDGNVYAADAGNHRIQVFDNNGTFKSAITGIDSPMAMCLTPGPNQVLYVSNSNPPEDFDVAGEIYKLKVDGTIVGKFGRAGKRLKEFGAVNSIDCRTENTLLVGEAANMRVQRIALK
jgi:hypothetical protein